MLGDAQMTELGLGFTWQPGARESGGQGKNFGRCFTKSDCMGGGADGGS